MGCNHNAFHRQVNYGLKGGHMKLPIIGSLLKTSKQLHIFCLGHYLQGTGQTLDLSNKMNFDNILLSNKHEITDNHDIAEVYNTEKDNSKDTYYNTWGKAIIKYVDNPTYPRWEANPDIKAIMDVYQFYPWCGHNNHFNICDCPKRTWGTIELSTPSAPSHIIKTTANETTAKIVIETISNEQIWISIFWGNYNSTWKHIKRIHLKKLDGKVIPNTLIFRLSCSKRKWHKRFIVVLGDVIWSYFGKPFHYYALRR